MANEQTSEPLWKYAEIAEFDHGTRDGYVVVMIETTGTYIVFEHGTHFEFEEDYLDTARQHGSVFTVESIARAYWQHVVDMIRTNDRDQCRVFFEPSKSDRN